MGPGQQGGWEGVGRAEGFFTTASKQNNLVCVCVGGVSPNPELELPELSKRNQGTLVKGICLARVPRTGRAPLERHWGACTALGIGSPSGMEEEGKTPALSRGVWVSGGRFSNINSERGVGTLCGGGDSLGTCDYLEGTSGVPNPCGVS